MKMIYTQTPTPGKKGTNIREDKYSAIYDAIIAAFSHESEILFRDLPEKVEELLDGTFEGSITWYTTTVKLDMESRGILERIPNARPQRLRLLSS